MSHRSAPTVFFLHCIQHMDSMDGQSKLPPTGARLMPLRAHAIHAPPRCELPMRAHASHILRLLSQWLSVQPAVDGQRTGPEDSHAVPLWALAAFGWLVFFHGNELQVMPLRTKRCGAVFPHESMLPRMPRDMHLRPLTLGAHSTRAAIGDAGRTLPPAWSCLFAVPGAASGVVACQETAC